MIDIDHHLLTAAQYASLTPFEQGFASYWQGARNSNIPDRCPYRSGSGAAASWAAGQQQAVIAAIDIED